MEVRNVIGKDRDGVHIAYKCKECIDDARYFDPYKGDWLCGAHWEPRFLKYKEEGK